MSEDNGRSIEEMAADDDEQVELFPMGAVDGDGTTLKTLIKPGQAVEQTVSIGSAEVPLRGGGLLDPNKEGTLLVRFEPASYTEVPVRVGDRLTGKKIDGWKTRTSLRPIYVERVNADGAMLEAQFVELLAENVQLAANVLDRLGGRMEQALASEGTPVSA